MQQEQSRTPQEFNQNLLNQTLTGEASLRKLPRPLQNLADIKLALDSLDVAFALDVIHRSLPAYYVYSAPFYLCEAAGSFGRRADTLQQTLKRLEVRHPELFNADGVLHPAAQRDLAQDWHELTQALPALEAAVVGATAV